MAQGGGAKHLTLEQRFPHGTQFFLPPNHGNVTTYMVVSSREQMSPSIQSPSTVTSGDILKSPPAAGVSQILANVTKTNLVSDIDNLNSKTNSRTNTVWVNQDQMNRKSQLDPMRRPIVQTNDKGHQIHVHKVHHGNARVKYVELKPVKDGGATAQPQQHGGYNQYYHTQQQNHHRLSVQTQQQQQHQQHSALSPLHSPPALQPPPTNPSRMPFVQKYQPATCNNGKATVLQAFRSIPDNAGKKFHHSGKATFNLLVVQSSFDTKFHHLALIQSFII